MEDKNNIIIACKVNGQEKKLLERAASKERRTVNNFIIAAALEKCKTLGDK